MKLNRFIITICSFILYLIFLASASYAWEDCSWHKVGYNKSHFSNQGDWCPNGKFITQLDFDGGGYGSKNMGNYPMVGSVKCCRPSPVSSNQTDSGLGKKQSAITNSDTNDIWMEINKIKKALGIE